MQRVRVLGVALMAIFVIGAISAVGASAHEFEGTFPTLLLAKADGSQLFITLAGHLVCNSVKGHGITEAAKQVNQKVTVEYSSCTAVAKGITAEKVFITQAEYEFNANGTVSLLKPIFIKAQLAGLLCNITVLTQKGLSTVAYDNIAGEEKILVLANVKGIETTAKGATACNEEYTVPSKTGEYTGKSIVEADGGKLKWV